MCRWMALVLLTCFSMTSRAIRVWSRMPQMLSKPMWRRPSQSGSRILPTSILTFSPWWRCGDSPSLPLTAKDSEVGLRSPPIMHQLEWHGSLTPLTNWWGVHLCRLGELLGWGREPRQDPSPVLGQRDHMEGHRRPNAIQLMEGVCPLPPQTGECQTLMDTLLPVRRWVTSIDTEAAEEVGKENGWCQRDWICQSLSQLIQGWR